MKEKLLVLMLLAGGFAAGQVSIGVNIGAPPPLRVERAAPAPGPGFTWVAGYWYPVDGHYKWHAGYWTRPPYEGAVWVGPRHDGHQFFDGHWEGAHGRVEHDHHSDREHDRDFHK